jgi:hypothetical protein
MYGYEPEEFPLRANTEKGADSPFQFPRSRRSPGSHTRNRRQIQEVAALVDAGNRGAEKLAWVATGNVRAREQDRTGIPQMGIHLRGVVKNG